MRGASSAPSGGLGCAGAHLGQEVSLVVDVLRGIVDRSHQRSDRETARDELGVRPRVDFGGDDDEGRVLGAAQRGNEEDGEEERREDVDLVPTERRQRVPPSKQGYSRQLVPVHRRLEGSIATPRRDAGIKHGNVERGELVGLAGEGAHGGERGEVERPDADIGVRVRLEELGACRFAGRGRAHGEDEGLWRLVGEDTRRFEADALVVSAVSRTNTLPLAAYLPVFEPVTMATLPARTGSLVGSGKRGMVVCDCGCDGSWGGVP